MVTASNGNVDRRLTTLYIAQPPQLLNRLHATHSIIRPHRPYYTYVDGGLLLQTEYCGLSVCHTSEPCRNGSTNQETVWVEDSDGPCI